VSRTSDCGFTLVELMVVVLIIGILVSIAIPVYVSATDDAKAKGCMANQRSITGALDMYSSMVGATVSSTPGKLASGGSGWYAILVPGWIYNGPVCPANKDAYYVGADGSILGDLGDTQAFKPGHEAP